jgi:hypothetical protein
MKRIVALTLCIIMVCVSFVSCALKNDPYTVVNTAIKNTNALNDVAATMDIEMEMDLLAIKVSVPLSFDIKIKNAKSENPLMSMELAMEMLGQSIEAQFYTEDGVSYVYLNGEGYQTTDTPKPTSIDLGSVTKELEKELFTDAVLVDEGDGLQSVELIIPEEMFESVYGDFISALNSTTGSEATEFSLSNTKVKIYVKDKYIAKYKMSFDMDMEVEGVKAKTGAEATITFSDPKSEVVITPPEGYKEFPSMNQ